MTDKTMTLEQVRDWLFACSEGESLIPMRGEMRQWADAITCHLSQTAERGEAVAKIVDSSISEDGYLIPKYAKLVNKAAKKLRAGTKLYTAQPPAAGVPDAVEKLSELMRGLEIPPLAAAHGPSWLYKIGVAIAEQAKRSANPSPAIDVAAVREVITALRKQASILAQKSADKLARAIGDAK